MLPVWFLYIKLCSLQGTERRTLLRPASRVLVDFCCKNQLQNC
uniref:Uncharacterized protein n=1 Tax=Rhizophora mucronata TaxID=61149 RepID=A0A2P2INW5_RHIMU